MLTSRFEPRAKLVASLLQTSQLLGSRLDDRHDWQGTLDNDSGCRVGDRLRVELALFVLPVLGAVT